MNYKMVLNYYEEFYNILLNTFFKNHHVNFFINHIE